MKKILIILFVAVGFSLNAQTDIYKNQLELNVGSSFIGYNTNKWIKGSFVNDVYATPLPQITYENMIVPRLGVGASAAYQLFHLDLLPLDSNSNVLVTNINRLNTSLMIKFYVLDQRNYNMFLGVKLGGTFWFGNISFSQLYDYVSALAPDIISNLIIKRIIPSNIRFAQLFMAYQLNIGGNYYFTDHFGVKTELAVGSPYWGSIGLSYRF